MTRTAGRAGLPDEPGGRMSHTAAWGGQPGNAAGRTGQMGDTRQLGNARRPPGPGCQMNQTGGPDNATLPDQPDSQGGQTTR